MRLLLDTNVIVFLTFASRRITLAVQQLIADGDTAISVASRWELGIKAKAGRFAGLQQVDIALDIWRFSALPILESHARLAANLPLLHKDPFDRMIVAQAIATDRTLVTSDGGLASYAIKTIVI